MGHKKGRGEGGGYEGRGRGLKPARRVENAKRSRLRSSGEQMDASTCGRLRKAGLTNGLTPTSAGAVRVLCRSQAKCHPA